MQEYSPFRDSMNESGLLLSGAMVTLKNIKTVDQEAQITEEPLTQEDETPRSLQVTDMDCS